MCINNTYIYTHTQIDRERSSHSVSVSVAEVTQYSCSIGTVIRQVGLCRFQDVFEIVGVKLCLVCLHTSRTSGPQILGLQSQLSPCSGSISSSVLIMRIPCNNSAAF